MTATGTPGSEIFKRLADAVPKTTLKNTKDIIPLLGILFVNPWMYFKKKAKSPVNLFKNSAKERLSIDIVGGNMVAE
jgi:hypothetical protein